MTSVPSIEISRATVDHVDQIVAIAGSWRPESRTDEELSRDGFLVSNFDSGCYRFLVEQCDYALVALLDDRVVGS